jgi:hypothetical protein
MYFGMRRSAVISFALHALILLAAILALPPTQLPNATDSEVAVDFVGPSQPQQGPKAGKNPAPHEAPVKNLSPKAPTPKAAPTELPPPPPPPPPLSPNATPLPTPPAPAPPPPPPTEVPTVAPTPPPPPPHPPQKTTSTQVQPPLPMPPPPMPTAPAQSTTHQPHPVTKPMPLSPAVLNTLQNLETIQKQTHPPTHVYNPDAGGDVNAGGNPNSPANSRLSGADKNAIAAEVRPCFDIDSGAENVNSFSVLLLVETDPTGVIRKAVVAPQDQDKLTDPIFAAFADRATNAVLDYQCSDLSKVLPPSMLGQTQTFLFNFTGQ